MDGILSLLFFEGIPMDCIEFCWCFSLVPQQSRNLNQKRNGKEVTNSFKYTCTIVFNDEGPELNENENVGQTGQIKNASILPNIMR